MRWNALAVVSAAFLAALGASRASLNPGAGTCDAAIDVGSVPPHYFEGSLLLAPLDIDWRSFRVESSRSIAISTFGDRERSDTNLVLFAGCNGGSPSVPLEANEDRNPGDYTSRVPPTGGRCLGPGTYFVYIGSFVGAGTELPFDFRIEDLGPCSLPHADRFEPDGAPSSARRIGVGSPAAPGGIQSRTIAPFGDIDIARFEIDAPAMVHVRAASPTGADTLLGVARAPDATFIAVNDDERPPDLAAGFESCLPAGSWFAIALARFAPDVFPYELSVEKSTPCSFEREPNDTRSRANALPLRGPQGVVWGMRDASGGRADVDVHRIVVPYRRGVILETSGYDIFDVDTRLDLTDARGNPIASDDDGGNGFLSRIERVLPAGTYFVAVSASEFEDPPDDSWIYSLTATLEDPPPLEHEPNDRCDEAEVIVPSTHVLGELVPAGDHDRYLLTVPASTQGGFDVEIVLRSDGDPVLDVFEDPDECAFRFACDDDSGDGLDPLIRCCFASGAYTLQLRDFRDDDPIASYSIDVHVRAECLPTIGCPVAPDQFGCDAP